MFVFLYYRGIYRMTGIYIFPFPCFTTFSPPQNLLAELSNFLYFLYFGLRMLLLCLLSRKILRNVIKENRTMVTLCALYIRVFSYLTGTQDWDKSADYFWSRSYKLLLLLLCCWVSGNTSLQRLETVRISLFSPLRTWKDRYMLWITQFPFGRFRCNSKGWS